MRTGSTIRLTSIYHRWDVKRNKYTGSNTSVLRLSHASGHLHSSLFGKSYWQWEAFTAQRYLQTTHSLPPHRLYHPSRPTQPSSPLHLPCIYPPTSSYFILSYLTRSYLTLYDYSYGSVISSSHITCTSILICLPLSCGVFYNAASHAVIHSITRFHRVRKSAPVMLAGCGALSCAA